MRRCAWLALSLLAGCGSSAGGGSGGGAPAGLEVTLSTDFAGMNQLHVVAASAGTPQFDETYQVPADAAIPGSLSFSPSNDLEIASGSINPGVVPLAQAGVSITLTFTGTNSQLMTEVVRTIDITMPPDIRSLAVKLEMACVGIVCGAGQTCEGGACTSSAIDVSTLPTASN